MKKTFKIGFLILTLFGIGCLSIPPILFQYMHPSEYKLAVLKEQKGKILSMKEKLQGQIRTLESARKNYASDIENFVREAQHERIKYRIESLANATERIKYNLRLIQESDAYASKLAELQKATESGLEEAIFMERRINAKSQMVQAAGDGKVLEKEITKLLDDYAPYAGKVTINPKDLKFKNLEEIWEGLNTIPSGDFEGTGLNPSIYRTGPPQTHSSKAYPEKNLP